MNERLYYRDSFLREFEARVVSCDRAPEEDSKAESSSWWVTLDKTAFYPTSGGQPHDTGRLGDAAVVNVFEREDGTIVQVTDREVPLARLPASIDWPRRFDHMQQHSGSHVLTAAFLALFNMPAVSFHMGKTVSTLDISASTISTEQLEQIERFANEMISKDKPVYIRFGTSSDLAMLGVRKESDRPGIQRAVEFQGIDIQACGGTHVKSTAQIGMILVRGVKKVRGNWRVEFVCGERARLVARKDYALLEDLSERLTCGPDTINAGITRILNERNAAIRAGQRYLEQSAALQAQLLLAKARAEHSHSFPRSVTAVLADVDMEYLRAVATNIVAESGVIALLGSEANGCIVAAKSDDVPGEMNALLREAVKPCGGKGGGTKQFAQGNVPQGTDLNRILRHVAEHASKPFPGPHSVGNHSAAQSELVLSTSKSRG